MGRPTSRRRRRSACALLPALVAAALAADARAQALGPPLDVSQSGDNAWVPTLAVDPSGPSAGTIHVAWHDFTSSPNLAWCATRAPDGTWSFGAPCAPEQTRSWTPRLAADPAGGVAMAWRDRPDGPDDIVVSRFDGVSWSPPVNVSSNATRSTNPTIAIDRFGDAHVMWEDGDLAAARFWEAHQVGGAWQPAAETPLPFVAGSRIDTLRIACDSEGTVHAVWHDGPSSATEVYHAERPLGGPWSAPVSLSQSGGELSAEPAIAVGADDVVHVAWVEQDPVVAGAFGIALASRATDGTWSEPVDISRQGGMTFRPSVAVHPTTDTPAVAWTFRGPDGDEVYLSLDPPAAPVNVSGSPGAASQRPGLAFLPDGEPVLAWQQDTATSQQVHVVPGEPPEPPEPIDLRVAKSGADALLTWTGGAPSFDVLRSPTPEPDPPWTAITPVGGVASRAWDDVGVVGDGRLLHYLVE